MFALGVLAAATTLWRAEACDLDGQTVSCYADAASRQPLDVPCGEAINPQQVQQCFDECFHTRARCLCTDCDVNADRVKLKPQVRKRCTHMCVLLGGSRATPRRHAATHSTQ